MFLFFNIRIKCLDLNILTIRDYNVSLLPNTICQQRWNRHFFFCSHYHGHFGLSIFLRMFGFSSQFFLFVTLFNNIEIHIAKFKIVTACHFCIAGIKKLIKGHAWYSILCVYITTWTDCMQSAPALFLLFRERRNIHEEDRGWSERDRKEGDIIIPLLLTVVDWVHVNNGPLGEARHLRGIENNGFLN